MSVIRTIQMTDADADRQLAELRAPTGLDALVLTDRPETRAVREVIAAVRNRGDDALIELTERFDHVTLRADEIRVSPDEIEAARQQTAPAVLAAIRTAIDGLRRFQASLLTRTPPALEQDGVALQGRYRPLRRAGACVPGAAAPLPSSAIHCIVPAQVAGVAETVIVAPPRYARSIHPTTLAVAAELGVTDVYRIGGAQAVAALALGTQTVRRVDKIVGPGSVYVQLAKRLLYGVVGIDMFAGPSEVVVIADDSANPAWVATDLLAQAEHDPGCAMLVTADEAFARTVEAELAKQLPTLSTAEGARRSLETLSAVLIVADLDHAVALTNEIAPEHLHVQTRDAAAVADRIDSAGAIFVGPYSPESSGDYVAGPSHVLPTGGGARFFSGLCCNDFLRRTSMITYSHEAIRKAAPVIATLARAEGLDAHARSATTRTDE
jgi:histidinol dehydrogenase